VKKALVTGGCGFIGSHLVDRLIKENFHITVIDNCSTGRLLNLDHIADRSRLNIIIKDLNDPSVNLEEITSNVEVVYHLAALADIVPSIQNPVAYYMANVQATLRLVEACRNKPNLKKLVYAASSSCYGIPEIYPTPETSEINPEYPYALTKRLGEELVLHWGKLYKIPVVSCRFFNVYGPRSRTSGTYGAVFGVFLAQKIAGKPFTIVGDGKQTRDFTFVTDVADAVFTASQSNIVNEIMNVGSGNHYSVNKLVELLGGEKTYIPKRPGEPDCTFADITKIKRLLNWSPKIDLETGVSEMIKNINYWKDAPVWTPEKIAIETEDWFKALSK
jgi:UDP-glucose 4-epimerase